MSDSSRRVKETFADRFSALAISGGVVRMDLASFVEINPEPGTEPTLVERQRIIMPLEGFLRSFSAMQRLVQDMEAQGIVKRRDAAGGVGQDVTRQSTSPNFD